MRVRQVSLSAVLIAVMVASTFQIFALGVLASSMIDDLGISRTSVGIIGAVNTGVGALTAPFSGRLTDRIGPRRAVLSVMAFGSVGMAVMAVSNSIWMLIVSAVISGVPQGWGNPATNALIADTMAPGQRGTITGIKQSGVTLAIVLAGATLPWLERGHEWQGSALFFAIVFVVLMAISAVLLRGRSSQPATAPVDVEVSDDLPPIIWRLGFFALLMGTSGGAIGRFLALFSEEALGLSLEEAGAVVALSGAVGMVARIVAARAAERWTTPERLLLQLSLLGVVTCALLASATTIGSWLIWPVAVLYAIGHTAWNAVINLAVIMKVPLAQAGRGSGIIMAGFLTGLTVSSPITGWIVDTFDTWGPVWIGAGVLAVSAAAVIFRPPSVEAVAAS